MKYDIIAAFYEKAKAKEPTYRCPLGVFCPPTLNFFEENGFTKTKDTTPGYIDYRKTVSSDELEEWTHEGYVSEVMDVLYCGTDFKRIELQAEELDTVDIEGGVPVRGLPISECFVEFRTTEPLSQVTFMEGDPYSANENTRRFHIPLKKLKDYFDVLTMLEVIGRMWMLSSGAHWSFDELKDHFESGVDKSMKQMEMTQKKRKLYFDMDGTLVDFKSGMDKVNPNILEQHKDHPEDIEGIFSLMDPMPGAIEAVNQLKDIYDCYILSTAPWDNPSAWSDKLQWVQKHLGQIFYKRLILTHHKELLNDGDSLLIDDRNTHGADDFGVNLINFKEIGSWDKVTKLLERKRSMPVDTAGALFR